MENRVPSDTTGPLTDAEREYGVETLRTTQAELHQLLEGLSDSQLRFKPSPDRWSVAECVEHIALVEGGIFKAMRKGMELPANPDRHTEIKVSDVDVIKALRSRKNARLAPAGTEPTGRFGDAKGALTAFDQLRNAAIDFLTTTPEDLRSHYFENRVFGIIDSYQALLMMASHSARHRKQIEEVKASEGYPQ